MTVETLAQFNRVRLLASGDARAVVAAARVAPSVELKLSFALAALAGAPVEQLLRAQIPPAAALACRVRPRERPAQWPLAAEPATPDVAGPPGSPGRAGAGGAAAAAWPAAAPGYDPVAAAKSLARYAADARRRFFTRVASDRAP